MRQVRWLRALAAVAGAAAITAGVVGLFTSDKAAASVFLLTLGVVLVLIAWLGPRVELESFELLGAKIRVRELVTRRLQLAETETTGLSGTDGETLHRQAATLHSLDVLYGLYAHIRATQRGGDRRTRALDEVARRMQAAAREADFDPVEVSAWFRDGNDPLRVVALNVMLARDDSRDVLAALEAIDDPHSPFEQYYGLLLARVLVPRLDELERQLVADAIGRARRKRRFRRDRPLLRLGDTILDDLKPAP